MGTWWKNNGEPTSWSALVDEEFQVAEDLLRRLPHNRLLRRFSTGFVFFNSFVVIALLLVAMLSDSSFVSILGGGQSI